MFCFFDNSKLNFVSGNPKYALSSFHVYDHIENLLKKNITRRVFVKFHYLLYTSTTTENVVSNEKYLK